MKNRYGITPWGSWFIGRRGMYPASIINFLSNEDTPLLAAGFFIDVLDSYQMGARLERGRTYANTGRVFPLELNAGHAIAKVEGNYRPSYHVEIIFPPLKEAEQVYRMIESDPPLLARIAAGELPEAFLQKLKKWHSPYSPALGGNETSLHLSRLG